jgi:hypothetical protein
VKIELKHGVTPCIGHSLKHHLNDRSIIDFKLFGNQPVFLKRVVIELQYVGRSWRESIRD